MVGAYFYTGRSYAKTRSLHNIGYTHQWVYGTGGNKVSDGDTFCVKRTKGKTPTFVYDGFKLIRAPIKGKISDQAIQKACKAKGKKYRPVCASTNYANGDCTILGSSGYWSIATQKKGVPANFLMGVYTHCGMKYQRGTRSLQNLINTHRWSDPRYDSDGDALCIEFDASKLNFEFRGMKAVRTRVTKAMTSNNVLAACKAKGLLPICANKAYFRKGKSVALPGVANYVSYPSQARQAGLPQMKLAGAGFWTTNPNSVLVNTGATHRWSNTRTDPNGWTYCAKAAGAKPGGPLGYNGVTFIKIAVPKGTAKTAFPGMCQKKGAKPLCNYGGWNNGLCVGPQGNKFWSYPPHVRSMGMNNDRFKGGVYYGGNQQWYYNTGTTHQGAGQSSNKGSFSYCVKVPPACQSFDYSGMKFKRAKFTGRPNNKSILAACKKISMKPVCNYASWSDGNCILAGGNTYWSYPPHVRSQQGASYVKKTANSWWYSGKGNRNSALFNTGTTHRWANGNDKNGGETFCAKGGNAKPFEWAGRKFTRVAVKGLMTSVNIAKACAAKNLKPACAISTYYDGQCEIVTGSTAWWLSYGNHAKSHGLSIGYIAGAYFYTGRNYAKTRSMQNIWSTHRWNSVNRDRDGDTICTRASDSVKFVFDGWIFQSVKVKGEMNSDNIAKACKSVKGSRPACAISSYSDGRCRMVGNWYLSHPSHVKSHGLSNALVTGMYFYTGRNQKGRSLYNRGDTQAWAHSTYDKDGPTMCITRTKKRKSDTGSFHYGIFNMKRVDVKGTMTNEAIQKACNAKKMKPVCVHTSYADGACEVVQQQSFWLSYAGANYGVEQAKVLGAYFFTGSQKNRKPIQNIVNTHRWVRWQID
jgi:hypothetical protein